MKKLFLTSGVILCMACPAFADPTVYDINADNTTIASTPPTNATCEYPTLGDYTGPRTFYAKWTARTYHVIYNPKESSDTGSTPVIAGGTENTTAVTQTTEAIYLQPYTVFANTAESLGALTQNSQYFTRYGYQFSGWKSAYNIGEGTNTQITYPGTTETALTQYKLTSPEKVNLYAQWTAKTIPVVYNVNVHGTATTQEALSDSVAFDATYTTKTLAATTITVEDGYEFLGWGQTNNATGDAIITAGNAMSDPWTSENTLNLYAIYNALSYDLTYDCGAPASGSDSSVSYIGDLATAANRTVSRTYDASAAALPTASTVCQLEGYHVNPTTPWTCRENTGNTEVLISAVQGTWRVADNVTCTVNWVKNTIGLAWEIGEGSTGANGAQYVPGSGTDTCTYDEGIDVAAKPERAGYDFQGWTTNKSSVPQGTVVFEGQLIPAGTSVPAPAQQDNN